MASSAKKKYMTKKLLPIVSHDHWHRTEKLLAMGFEILGLWFEYAPWLAITTSGNSLSPLGAQDKDFGTASRLADVSNWG